MASLHLLLQTTDKCNEKSTNQCFHPLTCFFCCCCSGLGGPTLSTVLGHSRHSFGAKHAVPRFKPRPPTCETCTPDLALAGPTQMLFVLTLVRRAVPPLIPTSSHSLLQPSRSLQSYLSCLHTFHNRLSYLSDQRTEFALQIFDRRQEAEI